MTIAVAIAVALVSQRKCTLSVVQMGQESEGGRARE
jgi:hypothetical protein